MKQRVKMRGRSIKSERETKIRKRQRKTGGTSKTITAYITEAKAERTENKPPVRHVGWTGAIGANATARGKMLNAIFYKNSAERLGELRQKKKKLCSMAADGQVVLPNRAAAVAASAAAAAEETVDADAAAVEEPTATAAAVAKHSGSSSGSRGSSTAEHAVP